MSNLIALLHGPDLPGLVARVAGHIFENGGNILHADQHRDPETHVFFQRVEWEPQGSIEELDHKAKAFHQFATTELGMETKVARTNQRLRVACFVSKFDHCYHDLLLRFKSGELPCEIVCTISNHPDLETASNFYGVPFHYFPVSRQNRVAAEAAQLEVLRHYEADFAVLARYMQILSSDFLNSFAKPVINIHHSFLPAFAGGRPYHQAHARGVKLIGATAHYATADLDEGPIIHQDVSRITHRHSVADMTRLGRDLEKNVLARAVRWQLEHRILIYHNKTVVFD